jgi:hypothetical protein
MQNKARIESLRRLGYSEREASFLCLAALHGGYFLRRQYVQFLGKSAGGTVAALIDRAFTLRHVKASTFANKTYVYHLGARPLYAALGEEDNRNRRERQPLSIKRKLMGLDFVLSHPQYHYLATEQEKVEHFTGALHVACEALPTKRYSSSDGLQSTSRYFVDKCPIYIALRAGRPSESPVGFCFVDEGATTVSGFETYLDQYRRLFALLPAFEVVYLAASPRLLRPAERTFQRFLRRPAARALARSGARERELTEYFQLRRLYEARERSSFDRAKLIRLRDLREAFFGSEIEARYRRWNANEPQVLEPDRAPESAAPAPLQGTFSHCVLEHRYEFFGSLTAF